jgi:hypoxanthine phosphoribosyltransferase
MRVAMQVQLFFQRTYDPTAERYVQMNDVQEILFDEHAIADKVREIAARISADYAGKELVLICILKGAAVFTADLMRHLALPVTMEFIQTASYGASTTSSKNIAVAKHGEIDISGKHVLLVDAIIDTGETMACLFNAFAKRGPASLKAVVLLDKRSRRTADVSVTYCGFEIPDKFVVGYGMDYGEKHRNLPCIAVIKTTE